MTDKWDERFLLLAAHVAGWSKDPSTKVGCVIADEKKRVVALGYNGFPRGVIDGEGRLSVREVKYKMTVHSEPNAIANAARSVEGCTAYTWPFPPCSACAALMIQAGLRRVVAPDFRDEESRARWSESWTIARVMFDEAGVEVVLT